MRSPGTYESIAGRYDDLIGRDFFRRLRPAFEGLVALHRIRFGSAADVGSGTGLFARYLSRRFGVPVFAVERSPAMASVARSARAAGVAHVLQDMRSLALPRRVDLLTANHDTVNHLTSGADVRCFLSGARRALRPGGHLVFDFLTPAAISHTPRRVVRPLPGGARSISTIRSLSKRGHFETVVRIVGSHGSMRIVRCVERAYRVPEMVSMLREARLTPVAVHDASDLGPARPGTGRAIAVARVERALR